MLELLIQLLVPVCHLSQKMVRTDSSIQDMLRLLHSGSRSALVDLLLNEVVGCPCSIKSEHSYCLQQHAEFSQAVYLSSASAL